VRAARDLAREIRIASKREIPAVVDPVIAASSGGRFLDWAGVEALRRDLAPCGVVLTPNLMEAAELSSVSLSRLVAAPDTRITAARSLIAMGAVGVVIKGGHGEEDPVLDLVMGAVGEVRWVEHARIPATIRGSGCQFATRLAAGLGRGWSLEEAAEEAGRHVAGEIARAAGAGFGLRA
jgi:hydroxymethylpyrimidine/phosphomethylpyrimidine kinase